MSNRSIVILGTSSQFPTKTRNHSGYFLRWDGDGILVDAGEGTQRQMTHYGVSATQITRILITHLHGDHCLGLPGVLQRISADRVKHRVDIHFPVSGADHIERLCQASVFENAADIALRPIGEPGTVHAGPAYRIVAEPLRHGVETYGYRLEEHDDVRMLPHKLTAAGVYGTDIGRLKGQGQVVIAGRVIRLEDVSEPKAGQSAAFVFDTAPCEGAVALARDADVVVCEATYLTDEDRPPSVLHLTADEAARIAAEAGAKRLVLTHFSSRYTDVAAFAERARRIFPGDLIMANDGDVVPLR